MICHFCNIEMIDGQCPECKSILLTELWRRQDMAEMLKRHEENGFTETRSDPFGPLGIAAE
jgi:hypothetical protein